MDVREPSRAPEVGVRPRALRGGDRRVERRARPVRDDQEVRAPGPRVERRGGRVDPHAQGAAQGRIADVRGPDREHVRRRPGIRRLIRAVPIHRRRPMNTTRLVRALALAALLAPANARAAGYSIYEQGAAAIGMAGAYVASAHDGTAQFYDPAALTRLDGTQFSIGGSWLTTRTSFAGVAPFPGYGVTEQMKNGTFFPPNAYWTSHLGSHWAYGLGVNAPFGLGVEWKDPEQFTGRERVTKATLQALNGSIDLAWAPGDALSLAAGFNALYAKVELNNIATFLSDGGQPVNVSRAKLESDFTRGYGWNAAALANPWTNWRLGLSFKSKITVNIDDGRATFTQIPTGDAPLDAAVAASLPANQGVKTQLLFPASLTWGLAWNPQPEWTDEIDGVWTGSSAFEKLPLQFSKDTPLDPGRV